MVVVVQKRMDPNIILRKVIRKRGVNQSLFCGVSQATIQYTSGGWRNWRADDQLARITSAIAYYVYTKLLRTQLGFVRPSAPGFQLDCRKLYKQRRQAPRKGCRLPYSKYKLPCLALHCTASFLVPVLCGTLSMQAGDSIVWRGRDYY